MSSSSAKARRLPKSFVSPIKTDIYGQDLYKPELFSHSFRAVRDFDPMVDGIRIYRRIRRSLQQNPGDSGMFH
jgi:hypothetical protein